MKEVDRLVTIVVGAVVLFVAYDFWTGAGYFDAWFFPEPDAEGNVNSADLASAGFFSSLLELVAWLLSTVGTVAIMVFMGVVRSIGRVLEPLWGGALAAPVTPATPNPTGPLTTTETQRAIHPDPGALQRAEDTARLLVAAAAAADRRLTIALAESLAGRPYLTVAEPAMAKAPITRPAQAEPTTTIPRAKK